MHARCIFLFLFQSSFIIRVVGAILLAVFFLVCVCESLSFQSVSVFYFLCWSPNEINDCGFYFCFVFVLRCVLRFNVSPRDNA